MDAELQALIAERDALLQENNKPEESALSRFGRAGARALKDIPVGALSTLDFIASPVRGAMNYGNELLGGDKDYFQPLSSTVNQKVDELTGGYTAPQNLSERIGSEAAQAVSGFAPARSIGSKLIQAAPGLADKASKFIGGAGEFLAGGTDPTLTNVGAITTGIAAREKTLENNPESKLGALGNELIANVGTRKLSSLGRKGNLASKVGKATKFNQEKYKDSIETGMPMTLPDVSDSAPLKWTENLLRKTPFAGHHIEDVKKSQKQKASKILGQDVSPDSLTQEHGGKLAGEAAKASKETYKKKANYLWKKVEKATTGVKDKTLKTPNTNEFFTEEWKKAESSKGSQQAFKESPIGKLADLFEEYHYKPDGDLKKLTFEEFRDFRDKLRDKITTFGVHGNVSQGELKTLEGNIQEDFSNYFSKLGPDAKKAWKNFNRYTSNYIEHYKPIANDITEEIRAREPVKAFNISMPSKSSVKEAVHVMDSLGEKAPQYWSTVINKWGTFKDNFEPMRAIESFKGLDKSLQNKLLKSSGYSNSQQNMFRRNIDVMSHIKDTLKENQTSGTSVAENYRKFAERWGSGLAAVAGLTSGSALPIAVPIAFTAATKATAKAFVSPKLQAWIDRGMSAKNDKILPKWIEHGLRKVPGIPSDVKKNLEDIYSYVLESDKARDISDLRKAIPSILEGHMTKDKKK